MATVPAWHLPVLLSEALFGAQPRAPLPVCFRSERNVDMTLHDILRNKGANVMTIGPDATLADVAQTLVRHNIGSLLVCQPDNSRGQRLLGIITERDLVRACARNATTPLERMKVADVMVRDVITVSPADSVEDTMGLMTERRIRHLPVVEEDRLVGIISIGDVVKAQHDSLTLENHYLKSYIQG